jgi:hypothetical protein
LVPEQGSERVGAWAAQAGSSLKSRSKKTQILTPLHDDGKCEIRYIMDFVFVFNTDK